MYATKRPRDPIYDGEVMAEWQIEWEDDGRPAHDCEVEVVTLTTVHACGVCGRTLEEVPR